MKLLKKILLVLAVTLVLVGCDLTTKEIAKSELQGEQLISYLGGTVKFIYAENTGGLLSLGSQISEELRFVFFRLFVALVLAGLFLYIVFKNNIDRFQASAMVLILSGGIGNLINRFTYDGRVIDFMVFKLFGFHTGIFNIADVYVTTGIIFLFFSSMILKFKTEEQFTNNDVR